MTEDEAENKVCPMSFNTPHQEDILSCAASHCACWRWDKVTVTNGLPPGNATTMVIGGVPANVRTVDSDTNGRCGLINAST